MNRITNPDTGVTHDLYSREGKHLLKQLIQSYNQIKRGGEEQRGGNSDKLLIESISLNPNYHQHPEYTTQVQ